MIRKLVRILFAFILFQVFLPYDLCGQSYSYKSEILTPEERAEDLLQRMTLEEKIAQLRHLHSWDIFDGQDLAEEQLRSIIRGNAWGFVEGLPLFGESCKKNMERIQKYMVDSTRLGIPAFIVGESLHGSAHDGSTIFPQHIALGSTFNPQLAYEKNIMVSRDLHSQGIKQVLGPCIDVGRDLRWGRIEECYGEDPYLCGKFAVSEVKGYLDSGISPMLKHYGPHGNPLGGFNLASVECGTRDLFDIYLKPFEMVVKELPVQAVMSSYNSWNRVANSASLFLLTEVLRNRWGFTGYVYSDWGSIEMLHTFQNVARNKTEAALMAISAGLDVEASSNCYNELAMLVETGKLDEAVINQATQRVLTAKFRMGLFDDPFGERYKECKQHTPESVELSRRIADESVALLKNENNLLPLDVGKLRSIAVIGPNADQVQFGDYTWSRSNEDGVTPLEGLKKQLGNKVKINYAKGCDMMSLDESGIPEAVDAARNSDVAFLFCGSASASLARDYNHVNCGEGFDLHDINLTGAQSRLIKEVYAAGKPVVLILVSGKPFAIPWEKENIPAILVQWYAGEEAGSSIADILFGHVNPSGHLTFSFPQSTGHLPVYYNHLPTDKGYYKRPGSYEVPGRDYVFSSPDPLWAFGHGLSYTTFSFDELKVNKSVFAENDDIELKVSVTNTGDRSGKEVVQVYIRRLYSPVATPVKQLKAFEKIDLTSGQSKEVLLSIPIEELHLTDENGHKYFEPGEFEILVGNSSDNILLKQTILAGDESLFSDRTFGTGKESNMVVEERIVEVSGTVRDVQATPLKGVKIYSASQNKILASTDENGKYNIAVSSNDFLTFTLESYASQEIKVMGITTLNVRMNNE